MPVRLVVPVFVGVFSAAAHAAPFGGFPPYDGKNFVPEVSGEKTGFFHTTRTSDGKWWVIDPLGRGFGVFGTDHIRMDGHYTWQGETHPQLKGNLRTFGSRENWEKATIDRLNDWGFTMLGAGSEEGLRHRGLVHTEFLNLGRAFSSVGRDTYIAVNNGVPCSGFPNVFHPDFPAFCAKECARLCTPQRNDPWLFGYFIDNELAWWGSGSFDDGLYKCAKALPKDNSAHRALDAYLKANGVTSGEPSVEVMRGFTRLCAEKYFAIASEAIRKADPNHLVLGARFAWTGGPHVWREAGRYCDLITVNCYAEADLDRNVIRYQNSTLKRVYEEYYGYAQKPLLVTEWSFPALDSGLPCTEGAGQRFRTQAGRTRATKLFAQTLLSLPFVVGYDYFMWSDEPATGIACYFPENTNYGLTDNDGRAYPEITAMFKDLQRNVWRERAKQTPAENSVPKLLPIDADTMMRALKLDPAAKKGKSVACVKTNGAWRITNAAGLTLDFGRRQIPKVAIDGEHCGELRLCSGGEVCGKWRERDSDEIVRFDFRNDGAAGVVEADLKGGDGSLLTVRLTVWPDFKPFLFEVLALRNDAAPVAPAHFFWLMFTSPFRDYSVNDSVQQLWRRPPYGAWFAADGKYLGAVSQSEHFTDARFRRLRDGSQNGGVTWKLPEVVPVSRGATARFDGCYALVVPGRGGRRGWRDFTAPLRPSVDETGLDLSPACGSWPLITMRQMSSTSQDTETLRELIAIHAKYPGSCGEYWLAEGNPPTAEKRASRARALGDMAPVLRAAGIRVGFQQGVTLRHDGSSAKVCEGSHAFPADAYQVDVDGKPTFFLCPTSPDVLAHEEAFAEEYVRLAKAESFWLDDDLRLGFGKGRTAGCWCERCLKKLNAKAKTNLTRAEWIARLGAKTADEPLRAVWTDFIGESLAGFAAAARRGAKKANPDVRMGYQAISSATFASGRDNRAILAALSDDFRDTVGIRPGHGFYTDCDSAKELVAKLLDVAREAERCRAIPGWKGSIAYEQENWPHYAMQKSVESCVKECAAALAAGCDAVAEYWYSSSVPEPLDHYEDFARLSQAWRPYFKRLADISVRTHLGGVAHRDDPKLVTSAANTPGALITNTFPRRGATDVTLARMGVPVTVEAAGTKAFYDPKTVPSGRYTTAERAKLLDELDALPGGPVCVRVDKVHPLVVWPRVDAKGRTVAVTLLNVSTGRATRVPVRVRRPASAKATLLRPCQDESPLALKAGDGDEALFTLPDLAAWSMLTIVFR